MTDPTIEAGDVVLLTARYVVPEEGPTFGVVQADPVGRRIAVMIVVDRGAPVPVGQQEIMEDVHVMDVQAVPLDKLTAARIAYLVAAGRPPIPEACMSTRARYLILVEDGSVDPRAVSAYLTAQAWTRTFGNDSRELWELADKGSLMLPLSKAFVDYPQRMCEALHTIALLHGLDASQLLTDIGVPLPDAFI